MTVQLERLSSRVRLVGIVAALLLLGGGAEARADTSVLTVTTTTGESDPAAGVPRTFVFSGVSSVPNYLFVKYRATGGAPCGPSAESDSGVYLNGFHFPSSSNNFANGAFSFKVVETWDRPGETLFCMWLGSNQGTIATPIAQIVTFRAPVATISGVLNPSTPRPKELTTLTVSGATETPGDVFAKVRRAGGAPCAPTPASDTGTRLLDSVDVNGAFSTQATATQQEQGTYLVCLWLISSPQGTLIAGPQPVTFSVVKPPPPPPPCVVPGVRSGAGLARVKRRVLAAHCSLGGTVRVYSRRVARRGVIRLRPRSQQRLANLAAVTIVVSKGPKPRPRRGHRR